MKFNKLNIQLWFYFVAAFFAAFLLFQIQPMISKAILPLFGGSYLVWASCMMFFQAVLLLGYWYAHKIQRLFSVLRYAKWHWILLLIPLVMFPYRFSNLYGAENNLPLYLSVPMLLLFNVGLPFFALSTASIILQSWFSKSDLPGSQNPYMLYGASNIGSMLALLSYPVVFEPLWDLSKQGYIWWIGYAILFGLFAVCKPRGDKISGELKEETPPEKESFRNIASWFLLSFAACFSLLAVTNTLTLDIASVPFLWVLPLSVYLLTFVLTFKRNPWYPAWINIAFASSISIGIISYLLVLERMGLKMLHLILFQLIVLFFVCLNCHGLLIKNKPKEVGNLTLFYFIIAAGGLCGSVAVGTVIPLVTNSLIEYPLSFVFVALAMAVVHWKKEKIFNLTTIIASILCAFSLTVLPWIFMNIINLSKRFCFVFMAAFVFISIFLTNKKTARLAVVLLVVAVCSQWTEQISFKAGSIKRFRNFYGIYNVFESEGQRCLQHGKTLHGRQYIDKEKSYTPLSYFHPSTPAGTLLSNDVFEFRNIAMIGLGTGALASYMKTDQSLTIFELDPENLTVADEHFSYLQIAEDAGANLDFVFGDGRISLRKKQENFYDLLIIDAFNGGSIPVHLLTSEAVEEYFRVLKPDGAVLLHISNAKLNLLPVIYSVANRLGLLVYDNSNISFIHSDADYTVWMFLFKSEQKYLEKLKEYNWKSQKNKYGDIRPWTDSYTNIFGIMKW